MPTPNCPPERGQFICICVTVQTARENAGQESRRLRPTCDCHAPRSNGLWRISSSMDTCKRSHATVTMGAAHPTCIPCSKAAKKRSPPPREDCAFLLNPGEVHDGPPKRTHSTGDLIQRKNSGIVAEYRIYFNIEMGQAASVYTCYLPCRNRYFFFMDRNSIYPRLPRGSN